VLARACLRLTLLLAAELLSEMEVDDAPAAAAPKTPGERPASFSARCRFSRGLSLLFLVGSVDSCASAPGRPGTAEASQVRC